MALLPQENCSHGVGEGQLLLVQFFHQTWEVAFEEVSVEPGDVTNDNYGQLVSGVRGGGLSAIKDRF